MLVEHGGRHFDASQTSNRARGFQSVAASARFLVTHKVIAALPVGVRRAAWRQRDSSKRIADYRDRILAEGMLVAAHLNLRRVLIS